MSTRKTRCVSFAEGAATRTPGHGRLTRRGVSLTVDSDDVLQRCAQEACSEVIVIQNANPDVFTACGDLPRVRGIPPQAQRELAFLPSILARLRAVSGPGIAKPAGRA